MVGLAAGWATVTEYPAAPASAMLAVSALSQAWPRGTLGALARGSGVCVGSALCAGVLFAYLHAAFGAFRPSYSYYDPNSFSFMQQQGYMGLTYPHPDRLLKLLFGCSRGLFFASPVMVAAVLGLWRLWKEDIERPAMVAAAITPYYFLFNASFYWWKAGLTFGPRYAGACIPLTVPWTGRGLAARDSGVAQGDDRIGLCSVFFAMMVVSTTSQLSMQDSCPLMHSVWPAFWSEHLAMNHESMLTVAEAGSGAQYGAFNLGQLLGLRGLASLIPLLAMWGIAVLASDRESCRAPQGSSAA